MTQLRNTKVQGFSLVEMAIVIVIFGLLLATFLMPLQAQRNVALQLQTDVTLDSAKQALLGFAQANGRLPCPATGASNGAEAPLGGGLCTQQAGFLPAATLGIQPTDSQGYAIDAWSNRILYAVTQSILTKSSGIVSLDTTFTTPNAISNLGIDSINTPTQQRAMLRVCTSASAFATTCSAPPVSNETNYLTNEAVAVIYSTGATSSAGSAGKADEMENLNAVANVDTVFVSHDIRANDPNGEFDHQVIWISPYILYNAMLQAGQLH